MGDPACHLSAVCLTCGRFIEESDFDVCPHCGAPMDGSIEPAINPVFDAKRVNTILYCDAFEATEHFYRHLLGLEVAFANDWFVEFHLTARATLSIADASRATIPAVEGKGVTISVEVDDLDALRGRLIDHGVDAAPVTRRFGSPVFDIHDPEGHRLEFWSDRSER